MAGIGLWMWRTVGGKSFKADRTPTRQAKGSVASGQADTDLPNACRDTAGWILRELRPDVRALVRVPFVVAGDLDDAALDRWHRETLGPGLEFFSTRYFDTRPDQPITVLLFRDRDSYREHSKRFFGHTPTSPYGYYRDHLRVMVVDAQAGPGAVLHELTHALMAFDYSAAPAWLREGLAAIHEDGSLSPPHRGQSRRLPVLLDAMERGELQSLESLVRDDDFDGSQQSLSYAQTQQFCLYLQQRGLLERVYRQVRENHRRDPSGEATLRRLLGNRPWPEIDADLRMFLIRPMTSP